MRSAIDHLIGSSPALNEVRSEVECAARSDAKVLLTGESGVGKDIAARVIHQLSARSHMPLLTINCVSVADTLLEAELFGHVRGSFTGAYRDRPGLLETAHKGTVFLDEVCEMSTRMQALLLRFMETGEIQRVGADRVNTNVDVRVLAATNRDPEELVASKLFRADLYYRLNVIDIRIPPLRARREDIAPLFEHFLRRYAQARGIPTPTLASEVVNAIVSYDWPGNVRQLKNIAERLIVRLDHSVIRLADLPAEILGHPRAAAAATPAPQRSAVDDMFERMVKHGDSFWSVVYPPFMARDLTREDLRLIVQRGLRQTAGSYKLLVDLLNMRPTDYKRFLNFLRKHECHVPFARFRSAGMHRRSRIDDDYQDALLDSPPVIDENFPVVPTTGTARR